MKDYTVKESIKTLAEIQDGILDRLYGGLATKPEFYFKSKKLLEKIKNECL